MAMRKIEIRHITCVVNIQNTVTPIYLKFSENVNDIIKADASKTVSIESVADKYLVIYILPSPMEITITDKLKKVISNLSLDYVIIDELFPTDNAHFLKDNKHPIEALWIKNKTFSTKQSFIEVE